MHDFWFRTLKFLPGNTVIHKQDIFLKKQFDGANLEVDTFLQKSTKKQFEGRSFLNHYSLLFIGNTKSNTIKKNGFYNPLKKVPKITDLKAEQKIKKEFIDDVE